MKLQQLAVVFIIIVLPIALVLSEYTNQNIEVLNKQAEYDNILLTSTYDAVRAFQMNTLNNGYSTINDSKIRDISASVNSFYNSLATSLGSSGYKLEDLQGYIPALLFTMYDGYYLYGDYQNIVTLEEKDGKLKQKYSTKNSNELISTNGIKPYIYYTCEYKDSNQFDIIVNYTLDNYISVMGKDKTGEVVNKSGYLINPSSVMRDGSGKITAHGIEIKPEKLGEYIIILDAGIETTNLTPYNNGKPTYYQYVYYNHQKYYYDPNPETRAKSYNDGINFFRLNNNLRTYLNENEANSLAKYILGNSANYTQLNETNFIDQSAYRYYNDALDFSNYIINDLFKGVNYDVVTESYNNQLNYTKTQGNGQTIPIHARTNYNVRDVFKIDNNNDPEAEESTFNEHRMDVIISSIESNLMSIIANFNIHQNSGYEFSLPVMSEEEWYKITNNITVVSFMQGLPIGKFKYYSNYSVVANTKNKEFVSRDSIILREEESGNKDTDKNGVYHNPRCEQVNNDKSNKLIGYSNVDYEQQTVSYDVRDDSFNSITKMFYYYPHSGSGAYECIIGKDEMDFSSDNILLGTELEIYD